MTNPVPPVLIPNLFRDALSGEFTPPQDPQRRTHTLLGLAQTAISEGKIEVNSSPDINDSRISFYYNPDWEERIDADVFGDMFDGVAVIDSLFYVANHHDGKLSELRVNTDGPSKVTINDTPYRLEQGEHLAIARTLIAAAARDFFNGLSDS